MCSLYSLLRMENYQGDLTDIVRASATGAYGVSEPPISSSSSSSDWQFPSSSSSSYPINFSSSSMEDQHRDNYFGDPFSHMRDPLLHELYLPGTGFFSSPSSSEMISSSGVVVDETGSCTFGGACASGTGSGSGMLAQSIVDDDMKRPAAAVAASSNIFSRMLQISPSAKLPASQCESPAAATAAAMAAAAAASSPRAINVNSSKGGCLVENTGVQISSPRNPGWFDYMCFVMEIQEESGKASGLHSGARGTKQQTEWGSGAIGSVGMEKVRSKTHQRGYYRCSSSKGCSARKQVERSRADPNMLVITYTSEHNHPWPTQRNALAGSTRSQPSKNNASSKSSPTTAGSHQLQKTSTTSPKEEQRDNINENNNNNASPIVTAGSNSTTSASIKEEIEDMEKQLEMVDDGEFSTDHHHQGFPYRPSMPPDSNHSDQDFFADLGEIEADPLNLLFSQAFGADHEQKGSKGSSPWIESVETLLADWEQKQRSPTFLLEYWWMGQKAEEQKVSTVKTSTSIRDMTGKLSERKEIDIKMGLCLSFFKSGKNYS
ncbi:hypothetical protein FEM48_Zijuj01G0108900 [Ziziphus jujuba var. spinosa]|uniref:WRKY domain-containing protein n=1 Tax=Ziziphus jujuba var. spinosa TaxID=714518 RepID=A0A978W0U9_ZIZJJ|nr:hypothetical protein FEM48_Zijuj01G0108900 [Ziziphus jujuba var. spinosa]